MNSSNKLNDKKTRLVFIPLFGIIIPNVTGIFEYLTVSDGLYWFGYLYFIFLSFLVWQGNRLFLIEQRKHFDWFRQPFRKVGILLFANVFYTGPTSVFMLAGWYRILGQGYTNWQAIQLSTLIIVICVIFITHIYETVYLIKQREDDLLRVERIEKARVESELQALKNQIDPHFIFNSLNTLSHLIEMSPERALHFTDHLSDIYRFILHNKDQDLVMLEDEIHFLSAYADLLKIRFGDSINVMIHTQFDGNYLISPISLQLLLENAVKHNQFSTENPLHINVIQENDAVIVENQKTPKNEGWESPGIGLKNLNERIKLVMNKSIEIMDDLKLYKVKVPLLKISTV